MRCPNCSSDQNHVLATYHPKDGVRRRRKCLACGHRFSTVEMDAGEYETVAQYKHYRTKLEKIQAKLAALLVELKEGTQEEEKK